MNKLLLTYFASLCAFLGSALPTQSWADDRASLEVGLASSRYFDFFTTAALNYLQGTSTEFPTFDPQAARGSQPGNPGQLPPCDHGGRWMPIDEEGRYFVCVDDNYQHYCPSGMATLYYSDQLFYCVPYGPDAPSFRSAGVLENDLLATEGLKWFLRSQKHAALKFDEALMALSSNNSLRSQALKEEGCAQYNESSIALGATTFPANLPPLGFVHTGLLNDMMTALNATKAFVCP